MGRNETVMMSSEKKSAGPTSLAESTTMRQRSAGESREVSSRAPATGSPAASACASTARSRCLCMFSIMTIAASIIAPIAMAMPPSDMMSAPTPTCRMAMKAIRIPIGSVMIATSAERADDALLEQLAFQVVNCPEDQVAAVVDRRDDDTRR